MTDFMVHFLICNILIGGAVIIILTARRIFRHALSGRMRYNLWFILLGLLPVPFLPLRLSGFSQFFPLSAGSGIFSAPNTADGKTPGISPAGHTDWMYDFTLSVSSRTPSAAGLILFCIWICGTSIVALLIIRSFLRLRTLEKSALPLQNREIRCLYRRCLKEMGIGRDIPVLSTAYLKSPIITGFLNPRIYLPIHLISDYREEEMRFMILHELQHFRHHDSIAGFLMNLAAAVYWFNPFVWLALREMRNDREIACDASVLRMLKKEEYRAYGSTLINFAEKTSLSSFPFAAGLGGSMKQMRQRILNIASYEKPTFIKKAKGTAVFLLTFLILSGTVPCLSSYAGDESRYRWDTSSENVRYADFSSYFGKYDGSFVLYDMKNDAWSVYNPESAVRRTSPDSTYKIYDALFGLEAGVITAENSFMPWDGKIWPFEEWNTDQTLASAMKSSVNWYFQEVDRRLQIASVRSFVHEIGYGNENTDGDLSSYWMESSLKISPVEQVELLVRLYNNDFGFASENIETVKDAICLSASETGTLYGKTGTGRVDGQDINGWFVGFVEQPDNTYFFTANINADSGASGSTAAEIVMSVLSDMNIYTQKE